MKENKQQKDALQVKASWSEIPSLLNWILWQRVILTIIFILLQLSNQHSATLFRVYSLPIQADPSEKDIFYSNLNSLPRYISIDGKVIILDDFNARVGRDSAAWKGAIGRYCVGDYNDNGCSL